MMKLKFVLAAALFLPMAVMAGERNDLPSCFAMSKAQAFATPPSGRLLTVIVDQTTPLPVELQKPAWGHIKRFLQPGDKLRLYTFSAYLQGHYTKLDYAAELEQPIRSELLGDVPMMTTRKLDGCLKAQPAAMYKQFGKSFAGAMGKSSSDIPRSEILFSLKEIAGDLKQAEGVTEHVVLLMSDMLEYSDFGSFYASNAIRTIDPEAEMAKVEKQNLVADFSGARVYVHGAAYVPTTSKNGYRSGKMITNLQEFWGMYFEKSNSEMKGFGNPELTTAIE